MAGGLNRGDVHLYRFAPPDKQRPVLILTRDSAVGHLSTVTVAPISSTVRGVPSEVTLDLDDGMKGLCAVNLHNAVTVSQERLGKTCHQPERSTDARSVLGPALLAWLRLRIAHPFQLFSEPDSIAAVSETGAVRGDPVQGMPLYRPQ